MRTSQRLALLASVLVIESAAVAEPQPSLDLRNFHPPADPAGSLYLEPSSTPAAGDWNVGAWLSYANRGVWLEDASGSRVAVPLENQLSLDYVAAVGVLDRLALSLTLPTVLYQNGDDVSAQLGDGRLPQTALGDAAFGLKATLVPTSSLGGFGLAALARVTAPTGDSRAFVSDGAVTGELRLLAELKLIALTVQATGGAKVRGEQRTYVGEDFGHELPWGVALGLRPQALGIDKDGRWTWTAEARGQIAMSPELGSAPASPALAGLSARYALGDVSLIGGAELPLNQAVGSPRVRGVLGVSWARRFYDKDGDGVAGDHGEGQYRAECPGTASPRRPGACGQRLLAVRLPEERLRRLWKPATLHVPNHGRLPGGARAMPDCGHRCRRIQGHFDVAGRGFESNAVFAVGFNARIVDVDDVSGALW